jgi:hypothetical protein
MLSRCIVTVLGNIALWSRFFQYMDGIFLFLSSDTYSPIHQVSPFAMFCHNTLQTENYDF